MMTVPNYVGPSTIEGVGIFAAKPIQAGQVIWVLKENFDLLLPVRDLALLDEVQRSFLDRYAYRHMMRPDLMVLEYDNGRFMNHSDQANTDFRDPELGYALRDIAEGEEITCNYAEFDPSYKMQDGRIFIDA